MVHSVFELCFYRKNLVHQDEHETSYMTGNIYPTMKRLIALAVMALVSATVTTLAGPPVSPKEVLAPAPPPPQSYFRACEWSVAAFGAYGWTWDHNQLGIGNHYWGG